jgi:hypothetical protein
LGDMPSTRMLFLVIISPTQGQRRSNQRVLCRRSGLLLEKLAQSSDYADLAGRLDQPIGRSARQTRTLCTGTDRVRITRLGYHHHHRHGPRTEVDRVHQKREQLLFSFRPFITRRGPIFSLFKPQKWHLGCCRPLQNDRKAFKQLPNFLQLIHFKEKLFHI